VRLRARAGTVRSLSSASAVCSCVSTNFVAEAVISASEAWDIAFTLSTRSPAPPVRSHSDG